MGVNATPVVGKIRVAQPVANSLERLLIDGEKTKALALKLEEDLTGDDEDDVKPEPEEGERKLPGLREKGSILVEETISRVLASQGLDKEELDAEHRVRKVGYFITSCGLQLICFIGQAKVTLDHWISYLRHGLHTCYYCVAPMSFAEELHRKCVAHMRPHPRSKSEIEPIPEADGEMTGEEKRDEEREDAEMREAEDGVRTEVKEKQAPRKQLFPPKSQDEKWEEVLDGKLKPLLGDIDVTDYGGRDIEE